MVRKDMSKHTRNSFLFKKFPPGQEYMHVIPAIRRQRREDVFAFWVYTCSRLANATLALSTKKRKWSGVEKLPSRGQR